MNVGVVGLGKLGLPVAIAMASRGLGVYGYDIREPDIDGAMAHEEGFEETYAKGKDRLRVVPLEDVVANCDVVFCAVQTPHEPRFEGTRPLPEDRADFEYCFLRQAVREVVELADRPITLAVISTVLPGTMEAHVEPLLTDNVSLVYNPSFIAMGTTIRDFLDPEFVLLGGDQAKAVEAVYNEAGVGFKWVGRAVSYGGSRACHTSIPNAELIKVAYNTFIGLKLAFANTLMEVCHKTDCDVDEVTSALKLAHRRLISGSYLDGGMGDGGGCHPRDNIALSWLARELDLSHDLFQDAMVAREEQTRWLVDLVHEKCKDTGMAPALLGVAYKPASHIVTGSAAMLAWSMLMNHPARYLHTGVERYDPYVEDCLDEPTEPRVFLVGCRHPDFLEWQLPEGSVVIDPWRYIPDQYNVEVIRVGQHPASHHGTTRDGGSVRQVAA